MTSARLRRLREELAEVGLDVDPESDWGALVLSELDYALRPRVHERRVPSVGSILEPTTPEECWELGTRLKVTRRPVESMPLSGARLFADGRGELADPHDVRPTTSGRSSTAPPARSEISSCSPSRWGRPSCSATRTVRCAWSASFGVLRWEGLTWHHEPPISQWIDAIAAGTEYQNREVLDTLLEFAVHDLGARGIGAILLYVPTGRGRLGLELRLPEPPALDVRRAQRPRSAAARPRADRRSRRDRRRRRSCASSVSASFPARLPWPRSRGCAGCATRRAVGGASTTPAATVIVVSEDGPVTVLRGGEILGTSPMPRGELPWPPPVS